MFTISLCMIVKNEEAVLARCLNSIKDAVDEIIIVDTGSSDATKEIARQYTENIYDFVWVNDFSEARNFAFSKATKDYQMWLDADDVFPEDSLKKLLEMKKTLENVVDIITMKYITDFDSNENPVNIATRERLMLREKGYKWMDPVHECIPLVGNVFHSDLVVHHRKPKKEGASRRNLEIYMALEKSGKPLPPRQLYYYARELKDHGLWIKAAYYFEKFLETKKGWAEDNIAACFNLSACHKALNNKEKILPILFKSFEYDAPRAEICCEIGYFYKRAGEYAAALKWFEIAANMDTPDSLGFILADYWGYIPNIECCVCCCHLNDFKKAKKFNERAASFKPDAPAVEINRKYLTQIENPS
ncbi:MAG: glycosyltransferase [Defluviitaleaceae bacterium]|nr:glycosyltransferase [Defluviitaleaceae bacterium]